TYEEALAILQTAEKEAQDPPEKKQVTHLRDRALAGQIDEFIQLAAKDYPKALPAAEGRLAKANDILAKLDDDTLADQKGQEVHLWQALIWASPPSPKPDKLKQAIDLTRKALSTKVASSFAPRLPELCKALQPVASDFKNHPEQATAAKEALEVARNHLADSP